jgi:hypothetical protein
MWLCTLGLRALGGVGAFTSFLSTCLGGASTGLISELMETMTPPGRTMVVT